MNLLEDIHKWFYPNCESLKIKLTKAAQQLIGDLIKAQDMINADTSEMARMNTEISSLKAQVSPNEFTDWLKQKYGSPLKVLYNKRFVPNHPTTIIPYSPTEFIYESEVTKNLNKTNIFDIWTYRIQYITDQNNENYNEFWQFPEETVALGCGDCEDSSILRVSMCRSIGIKNTAVALGFWNGVGHAFPVMLKQNKIFILEATSNNYVELDSTTTTHYEIHWIFNEDGVWKIKQGAVNFG